MKKDINKYFHYYYREKFYMREPKKFEDFILDGDSESMEYKEES